MDAAAELMEVKKPKWSSSTFAGTQNSMKHLGPVFGKKRVSEIKAADIKRYQEMRLQLGASGRTVNIEISLVRGVLKRCGLWARIQPNVTMLNERTDVGRALSSEEDARLLVECGRSRSRCLLPFITLLIETGSRCGTLIRLQWKNVNFESRSLTFGKDKTAAGTNRTIPLMPRAFETLSFWAQSFPDRQPDHYVFPHEKIAGSGTDEAFGFTGATVYDTDPDRHIKSIKGAWRVARKRAGLPTTRLHDLRHTACSRMINARIPLPLVGRLLGWSSSTLNAMAARYGHFSVEEMRSALESVQPAQGYPRNWPKSGVEEAGKVQ
jgi:integrase